MVTVLRGGTVVDGSGTRPAFVGDVHVNGSVIIGVYEAESAPPIPESAEVVDCAGKMVTPGWVDQHTHYDGQVTW